MGRMKDFWIDNDHAIDVLNLMADKLSGASHDNILVGHHRVPRILNLIGELVSALSNSPTYDSRLLDGINIEVSKKSERLTELLLVLKDNNNRNTNLQLSMWMLDMEVTLSNYIKMLKDKAENDNLNSAEFYQKRLRELEANVRKLESDKLQNTKEAKQKDEEIKHLLVVIKETQKQLEEKNRQEDAQRNWNNKIEEAFKKLNEYQEPLRKEKKRLSVLFWVFGILSFVALILVCLAIFMAANRIYSADCATTLASCLPYYSPIPIIGILLWIFIVQMNREQRQLIILTQHLHNLSYTEGLLKSINIFAPGIEDAVSRINATVDKLLDNHLSLHPALILKEESLSRNEKNQSASISEMASLLKEIRELVK